VKTSTFRRACAVLVFALGLAASACASPGSGGPNPSAAGSDALRVAIAAPSDNAQVATSFEVQLDSSVPLGSPDTGRHHVHLYYDTPTPNGGYDLVYGDRAQVAALTPGTHTVLASLRNANHSDAGPRALITVTVGGGGTESTTQSGVETIPNVTDAY